MKRWIAFILALAINIQGNIFACGPMYPYGDEIRHFMMDPRNFNFNDFYHFYYTFEILPGFTMSAFRDESDPNATMISDDNIKLWKKRCKNVPVDDDISTAIYELNDSLRTVTKTNSFADYLFKHHDKDAIDYIDFAKKCSGYNMALSDPWERYNAEKMPARNQLIEQALHKASLIKDRDISIRYAFLAIRLAYYNGNVAQVNDIYKNYFQFRKQKTIIDYWGLYFKTVFQQESAAVTNYNAALLFSNAPDKRLPVYFMYDRKIPVEKVLALAKNNRERSAIFLLSSIRNYGRNLETIKKIYNEEPDNRSLSFLLLREINKLEDWILTPYYTNYPPSLLQFEPNSLIAQRIVKDKDYAQTVLSFVKQIDLKKVNDPLFIRIATAYLCYMNKDYSSCEKQLSTIERKFAVGDKIQNQLNIIRALCLTAKQENNKATLDAFTKRELMRQYRKGNYKFIFTIARDLEFKHNTLDAALLFSKIPDDLYEVGKAVYWKRKLASSTGEENFYYNYFVYMDEQYSPQEIEAILAEVNNNHQTDSVTVWKLSTMKQDISRLYDLLGTKYLRLNNLKASLNMFEKVPDSIWFSDKYLYKTYLNANPFYTNFYAEHRKTKADTVTFTKATIIKKLTEYLQKAEDIHNADRDYYYFLAANCYFNMTQYGNSWMMRRYSWSRYKKPLVSPDNQEFFTCNFAKQYYLKAKAVTKNKKFGALCLRMAARCENYRIEEEDENSKNQYFVQLKKQYPNYYYDLVSNCESFEAYFKARK